MTWMPYLSSSGGRIMDEVKKMFILKYFRTPKKVEYKVRLNEPMERFLKVLQEKYKLKNSSQVFELALLYLGLREDPEKLAQIVKARTRSDSKGATIHVLEMLMDE